MDRNRQDDRVVGRPARGGEPLRVVGGVVGRVVDTLVHVVEALLGLGGGAAASGTTEPYRPHPSLPQTSAAAQRLAARQRDAAVQRMAEALRAGKHLRTCLRSSEEQGEKGKGDHIEAGVELALAVFPEAAAFIKP